MTLDTDTTVHTLYGQQMGGRKSYNPKNKGKKRCQPGPEGTPTFLAETRDYIWGGLRNGDRPTGKQIANHLRRVFGVLPAGIGQRFARAGPRGRPGFYCWDAVEACEEASCQFVVVARKTSRLVEELKRAEWRASPNNDAGLAAHPSHRFDVNCNHFQLAMLAYNLNGWLMLFNREPRADVAALQYTTLATARLRFLFLAAKIWRHAGRTGVSYSDHYEEKGLFERLMDRLRRIALGGLGYRPVIEGALT